jgi:Protein of unknown function (DUF3106)
LGWGEGKKLGRNFIAVVAVIALGAGLAVAQGGDKQNEGGKNAPAPGFAHGQGPVYRGPGPHFGQWLRRNESLPPDEQLKKLEQNPDFKNLPEERQRRLRERLQNFNSLPPEKKDRILQRMEVYEHLTPDQQQRVHEMFRQFRDLPQDRRRQLNQAFLQMQGMTPEQRQNLLNSPEYRNNYSDQERELLRGMSTIGVTPNSNRLGPPRQ